METYTVVVTVLPEGEEKNRNLASKLSQIPSKMSCLICKMIWTYKES